MASTATRLRLNITVEECSTVLDHNAVHKMAIITIGIVEAAIIELFVDRFIEP